MYDMPKSKLRNSIKNDAKLFLCLAVVILVGFVPSYAGGITDIFVSIFGFFITVIASSIAWLLELIANTFLNAMGTDVQEMLDAGILTGFQTFTEGIRILATGLALAIVMWQLFVVLWGPLIGAQQTQSIGSIVLRGLIFVPLTYFIQPLAMDVLELFQSVYNEFLSAYKTTTGGVITFNMLSSQFNLDTFGTDFLDFDDLSANPFKIIDGEIQDILATVIACVMIIVITWQFIKLLLETAQRFVVMLFYVYLSPLAAACGVGANSMQITKSALTLFVSSGILWILNVWSIGVCLGLFEAIGTAVGGGATKFFIWALVTYGALKIAQQLDDIFNAVGATNVRLSGSLLDDIVSMTKMSEWAGKVYGGAQDALDTFGANGLFAGKDPNNPVEPGNAGGKLSSAGGGEKKEPIKAGTPESVKATQNALANASAASNGLKAPAMKTTESGAAPRSFGQQVADKAASIANRTATGRIMQGMKKTSDNISNRINAGVTEARAAADNKALNRINGALSQESPEDRAKALAQLAQRHPSDFNSQAVKDYMGENMGLAENQKVANLSVDKNGQMSALVATDNGNGIPSMSKVSGINDMAFGATDDHSAVSSTQGSGSAGTTASGSGVKYTDLEGNTRTAGIQRNEGSETIKDGKPVASFSVIPDDGGSSTMITAPAGMNEQEVASLVSGKASAEVQERFKDGGGDETQLMGSAGRLSMDDTKPSSVISEATGGSAVNLNTASIGYSDLAGNERSASVQRDEGSETVMGGKSMASFSVIPDDGGSSTVITAPANMTGQEVASLVSGNASAEVQERFVAGGGDVTQLTESAGHLNMDTTKPSSVMTESSTVSESTSSSMTSLHADGSTWTPEYSPTAKPSEVDSNYSDLSFSYLRTLENGNTEVASGYVQYAGKDEHGLDTYKYGVNGEEKGTISLSTADISRISNALMDKEGNGSADMMEMREKLGFTREYSDSEKKAIDESMKLAKQMKKGVVTSEEAPIAPDK